MPRRASAPPFNVDWIASSASRPRLFSPADVRPGETVPTRGARGRPPCAAAGTGPHSAGGRPQAKKGSNATTKSSPWIGTWRHYCLTYVRRNVTLYVDGQREKTWNATVNTSASALYVGADVNGSHTLSGAVDEVYVYRGALAAWQIDVLYQDLSPPSDSASNVEGRRTETSPAQAVGRADARAHGRADGPSDAPADACAHVASDGRAVFGPDVGADVGAVGAGAKRRRRSAQTTERERDTPAQVARADDPAERRVDPAADGAADDGLAHGAADARARDVDRLALDGGRRRGRLRRRGRRGELRGGPRGDDERDDRHRDRRDGRAPAPAPRRRARDDGPLRDAVAAALGGPRRGSGRGACDGRAGAPPARAVGGLCDRRAADRRRRVPGPDARPDARAVDADADGQAAERRADGRADGRLRRRRPAPACRRGRLRRLGRDRRRGVGRRDRFGRRRRRDRVRLWLHSGLPRGDGRDVLLVRRNDGPRGRRERRDRAGRQRDGAGRRPAARLRRGRAGTPGLRVPPLRERQPHRRPAARESARSGDRPRGARDGVALRGRLRVGAPERRLRRARLHDGGVVDRGARRRLGGRAVDRDQVVRTGPERISPERVLARRAPRAGELPRRRARGADTKRRGRRTKRERRARSSRQPRATPQARPRPPCASRSRAARRPRSRSSARASGRSWWPTASRWTRAASRRRATAGR